MKKLLITIPCYNEELVLKKTIAAVYEYAQNHFQAFDWRILIIDNASKDHTWFLAQEIQKEKKNILLAQEMTSGRGAALRNTWRQFPNYDIYSYMDADLATDLKDFQLLVEKVDQGFDLVTGSRYLKNSNVVRNPKREFLSRVYNLLLKLILRVNFKDAQCGFKAFSQRVILEIVPKTQDNGWFWDTELMILAGRRGYKILEIPVSWREVRDELRRSKVSHWSEICRQLKNIYLTKKRLIKMKL